MSRPFNPTTVTKTVAAWFRIKPAQIIGHSRKPKITRARHVAMYLLRENGLSLAEVGDVFKRNHASVIHACGRVSKLLTDDKEFQNDLAQITEEVKGAHT